MDFVKNKLLRVGVAINSIDIANINKNKSNMLDILEEARKNRVEVLLFSPLSITGTTCGPLFMQDIIIRKSSEALKDIAIKTQSSNILIFISLPINIENRLVHSIAAIQKGKVLAFIPVKDSFRSHLDLKRYFYNEKDINTVIEFNGEIVPVDSNIIFTDDSGLTISVDFSSNLNHMTYKKALIEMRMIASPDFVEETIDTDMIIKSYSYKSKSAVVVSTPANSESTSEYVFPNKAYIFENGSKIYMEQSCESENIVIKDIDYGYLKNINTDGFIDKKIKRISFYRSSRKRTLLRVYNTTPFVPKNKSSFRKILKLQATALARRLEKTSIPKSIIGLSGGLDSSWALIVTIEAYKMLNRKLSDIICIIMPGPGTSSRTRSQAEKLAISTNVTYRIIDITKSTEEHLNIIEHSNNNYDITYENAHARRRTHILMDISNKENGIVIGTGDLSEIALGWSTYNADQMSMYNVNSGIPKTTIQELTKWYACNNTKLKSILLDIVNTKISPELIPIEDNKLQETEEIIGSYIINDFFLYMILVNKFEPKKILHIASMTFKDISIEELKIQLNKFYKRFVTQQFKRTASPDGPQIFPVGLSKSFYSLPSDASYTIFKEELEEI